MRLDSLMGSMAAFQQEARWRARKKRMVKLFLKIRANGRR